MIRTLIVGGAAVHKVLFLLFCLFPLAAAFADPPEGYEFLSYDEGLRRAQADNRKVFVYFGRHGCGWCELTNKKGFSDATVEKRYKDHYVLVYVDAESGKRLTLPNGERITELELGARYKAFATPMFLFQEPGGETVLKVSGIQTPPDLIQFDTFVNEGRYRQMSFSDFMSTQEGASQ
jgi:thioredoxin-related protein